MLSSSLLLDRSHASRIIGIHAVSVSKRTLRVNQAHLGCKHIAQGADMPPLKLSQEAMTRIFRAPLVRYIEVHPPLSPPLPPPSTNPLRQHSPPAPHGTRPPALADGCAVGGRAPRAGTCSLSRLAWPIRRAPDPHANSPRLKCTHLSPSRTHLPMLARVRARSLSRIEASAGRADQLRPPGCSRIGLLNSRCTVSRCRRAVPELL